MSNWKFKVGDVIHNYEETATVIGFDLANKRYVLCQGDFTFHRYKSIVESMCELVKPKSLYEQALELVGLKIGDRFLINCSEFEVNSDNIYFVLNNKRSKTSYGDALISLLHNKDLLVKIKPKPKSKAELILDELEKVVDKAKVVLERSGR